jgi:hypothetical protein
MPTCHCGCGQRVPLGAGRASGRAVYVASFLPGLNHLCACANTAGQDTTDLSRFIRQGRTIYKGLLQACHGGDTRFMPSNKEVGDWEATALRLMRSLAEVDRTWFRSWRGPSNRGPLPPEDSL